MCTARGTRKLNFISAQRNRKQPENQMSPKVNYYDYDANPPALNSNGTLCGAMR
jgi:hypothetical protein